MRIDGFIKEAKAVNENQGKETEGTQMNPTLKTTVTSRYKKRNRDP